MSTTYVCQKCSFSCTYLQYTSASPVPVLNSHDYKVIAKVSSKLCDGPIVIPFETLSALISGVLPDKKFIVNSKSDKSLEMKIRSLLLETCPSMLLEIDATITAESLVHVIATLIQHNLKLYNIDLQELRLIETSDSYVTWTRDA